MSAQLERLEGVNLESLPGGESLLQLDRSLVWMVERTRSHLAETLEELRDGKTRLENRLKTIAENPPLNGVI